MTEQEAFERWSSVDGSVMRNIEMRGVLYRKPEIQMSWKAWQACAELKDAELANAKASHEAWEAEHIKDMGELNKQINELAAQNEALTRALEKCAEKFNDYSRIHAAKPDAEKAAANKQMADNTWATIEQSYCGEEILRKHDVVLLEQAVKYILSDGCHDFIASVRLGRFGLEKAE